jgi:hypothetical protein
MNVQMMRPSQPAFLKVFSMASPAGLLQRKCACGQHTSSGEACETCKKKRLQRAVRAGPRSGEPSPSTRSDTLNRAPSIVHDVLNSPGQALDSQVRAEIEPQFGHDFSQVRIHTNPKAAESAQAVQAQAYTVGHHLVFASGQYQPNTQTGKHLLAHELSHVVQQSAVPHPPASQALVVESPNTPQEHEAERAAHSIAFRERLHPSSATRPMLVRKLMVDQPGNNIPNPQGNGLVQTHAEAIEQYLRTLSAAGHPTVNRTTGQVTMDREFCQKRGLGGRFGRGLKAGFMKGGRIGAYFLGVGAIPGAILGALIGGIAGMFGADSQAEEAGTKTSSTCLCDFVTSDLVTKIEINDQVTPAGGATLVRIPSPNSPKQWGAATMGGQLQNEPPWLILGHELCGHAWLEIHRPGTDEGPGEVERNYSQNTQTGEISLAGDYATGQVTPPRAGQYLRHGKTVERENLIRAEHGLPARGYRLRDPYCGESFWQDRGVPNSPLHWQADNNSGVGGSLFNTYLDECKFLRDQLPESRRRTYRIDEAIPEDAPR